MLTEGKHLLAAPSDTQGHASLEPARWSMNAPGCDALIGYRSVAIWIIAA